MQGGNSQVPTCGCGLISVIDRGNKMTIGGRYGVTQLEVCISDVWESELENFSMLVGTQNLGEESVQK